MDLSSFAQIMVSMAGRKGHETSCIKIYCRPRSAIPQMLMAEAYLNMPDRDQKFSGGSMRFFQGGVSCHVSMGSRGDL